MNVDPFTYLLGLEQFGIKFGLENIRALTDRLGHPERAFRSVHVAGTNGKGSVTAMVDSAFRAAGHRSARYTSPHLIDLTERFVIDGHPTTQAAVAKVIADLHEVVNELLATGALQVQPTFFEVTTAAAFELFRRAGIDIAVFEVGLGGRLDATNVISPVVSAITSIAFDHQQYLGSTLAEIAREKAGTIKPAVPVVVGALPTEAFVVIEQTAHDRGAQLIRASEGVTVDEVRLQSAPTRLRLRTPARDYGEIELALGGAHQVANALVAVRVLEVVDACGLAVPIEAVSEGLATVRWPGRLERRTLPDGREALLDAAHNAEGAAALAAYLADADRGKPPLVFAAMRDKDVRAMLDALLPAVSALIVTRASNPRSADPETLAQHAHAVAPDFPVHLEHTVSDALATAWRCAPTIVVAGSIFLLADVLKEIGASSAGGAA